MLLLASHLVAKDDIKQDSNVSVRTFSINNEQELYNSLKRIYFSAEHENIADTNWTTLHISKRVTTGFADMDVKVQNVVLSTKSFKDRDTKELKLEIFTTQNDEITYYKSESFLHKLFWNRVEYVLGLQKEWINCYLRPEAIIYYNHILCSGNKPEEKQEEEN
jgi:hypothetical protein